MAFVEDRWFVEVRDPDGTRRKVKSERHGQPMRYRARYTDPAGRQRSKSFPDGKKREAERYVAATSSDVDRGTWTDPAGMKRTLRAFAEDTWYPALTVEHSTRARYRSHLDVHVLPGLGSRTLGDLAQHPSVIQQWLRSVPGSSGYRRVIFMMLAGILTAAVEDGLIPRNPCQSKAITVPAASRPRADPWPAGWVDAIRAELPAEYRAMVDCGAGLGMRQGEVFGLSPDDIDWLRNRVRVVRQIKSAAGAATFGPPKGGKSRDVPLAESTKLVLARHLADHPAVPVTLPGPDGKPVTARLMFTRRGRGLRASTFDEVIWNPARDRAKIPADRRNGFHALRHYFSSVLLYGGEDIRALSEHLGHHAAAFTLTQYTHLMPGADDRMRRIIDEAAEDRARTDLGGGQLRRRSEP